MKTQKFEEYENIDRQIKELKKQKKALGEELAAQLNREKIDNYETDGGKFYLSMRPTYEYSEALQNLEADVKVKKKEEVESGVAIVKENKTTLSFRGKKQT